MADISLGGRTGLYKCKHLSMFQLLASNFCACTNLHTHAHTLLFGTQRKRYLNLGEIQLLLVSPRELSLSAARAF
jgi:hypothetical protein